MSLSKRTLVIMGLGLIGGSLARSLRENGFCDHFVGYGHREPSLQRGLEMGVIDEYTLDLDEALGRADILVLAAPTLVAAQMLEQIIPRLAQMDSIPVITDVASVKGNLLRSALAHDGKFPPRLVLGHPIAGSEQSGVAASRADLFLNHRVILTPVADNDSAAVDLIRSMWISTGAEVVDMDVADHDKVLATTSHLPHVLAYSLVDALAGSASSADIFRFAAGGFRDFTRIASSDPLMWRDIAVANQDALLEAIDLFTEHLAGLREDIAAQRSDEILQTFTRAKEARDAFAAILAARNTSTS